MTENVCNASVLYLERYYTVCKLHDLVLDIAGDSLSPIAYSIPSEILVTVKPIS